ncbi:GntR family transcriptional regulator [Saccharopolyspora antimicrobica]|uniref:GntR family transcriptional regulator n=1 Tax=Saccharopolyspora antimicrobica TaxID=455193 RepID=A0A1I5F1I7_9PSEU|nr:GntR family transcriptional regulator [Saccharopolyspora antimicrobica]RKT83635.1 GntR family transcriptional regulator [Saccharopolyspora antimicrobica]SFO17510.1 GntR family transcriptional regulator [Saccharopolyspora antimicrobica]
MRISRDAPEPLHAQIAASFREDILNGRWPAHYKLPPEPALAEQLGVSRGTLRKALAVLIEEGLLVQTRGRGTFVTAGVLEPQIAQRLHSLSEDFRAQGYALEVQVVSARLEGLQMTVQALLGAPPGTPGLRLVRVFRGPQGPLAYLVNWVRADLCPGIEDVDFERNSLFDVLEKSYRLPVAEGRRTFSAELAREDVAEALEISTGSPVLYLEQVTYTRDGQAVEYSDVWINSTAVKVTSLLTR